jgi:alpha-beta hydrolase superfamily lysophospholipase
MANDARDFAAALRQRYPETPLFLLGESMGAAAVMTAMAGDAAASLAAAVDGIILLAPAVWARETMNPFQVGLLWLAAHTLPAVTLTGRGLHIRASDNNAMLRALSADPLIIKETRVDTIYGLTNLMDAALASSEEAMGVPVLILYGRRDEIIPLKPVRALLERLLNGAGLDGGAGKITLGVYDRGFHMLTRDLEGWRVLEDMAGWIADRHASLFSGAQTHALERLTQDD